MSSTTINAFVFKQQNDTLLALSDAVADIGCRIQLMTRALPASLKGQVDELLDREVTAIASTCHCLGEVALAASNEAERWQSWAEDTDTLIMYDPRKPVGIQALAAAGGLAGDQPLQGILEQIRSVWQELDDEGRLDLCGDLQKALSEFAANQGHRKPSPVEAVLPEWKFGPHRIRLAREARGMKRADLASLIGTSLQQLRDWEAGEGSPDQEILSRICTALDCPPKFFFVSGA